MQDSEVVKIVEAIVKKLKDDGTIHVNCPWDGINKETIEAVKTLPHGAVKMVAMTWGIFSRFGQLAGRAIAVGAFLVVIALFCLGGIALFKLGEFVMSATGK